MHNMSLANGAKDDPLRHRAIHAGHPSSGSKQPVPTVTEPRSNVAALAPNLFLRSPLVGSSYVPPSLLPHP